MRRLVFAALLLAVPAVAQMPMTMPGKADTALVTAGTYKVDPNHTQVMWTVNHMGISPLTGMFGAKDGTLEIDPAKPNAGKVSVTFDTTALIVTSPGFAKHLSSADFFDVAKFPTASFTSTGIVASGNTAKITGNLTIKGITKPVIIDAKFYGAGANPMSRKLNVGFHGSTTIKRSDFGLGMAVPVVSDEVKVSVHAAFQKI